MWEPMGQDVFMASTTVYEILDDLWYSATSEADKGSKFERLMAAYLRLL